MLNTNFRFHPFDDDAAQCTSFILIEDPKPNRQSELMYNGKGGVLKDIAILETESFVAANYLHPSPRMLSLHIVVTIIGYPNEIKYEWLETQKAIADIGRAKTEAMRLFISGSLEVSQETIESTGVAFYITYPYVLAWGGPTFCTKDRLLVHNRLTKLIAGVHIERADKSRTGSPMAISFTPPEIKQFLGRYGLI